MINSYTDLKTKFSTTKGEANILIDQIAAGYTEEGMSNAEEAAATVSGTMGGAQYLALKQQAFDRIVKYFESLGN